MKTAEAHRLGCQLKDLASEGQTFRAFALIEPLLSQKIPFHILDITAAELGSAPFGELDTFLKRLATVPSMGTWAIVGTALRQHLKKRLGPVLGRAQAYIVQADTWFGCDEIGERVLGPAMVAHFGEALNLLTPWRTHKNRWVRRVLGVGGHVWAKRARGEMELNHQAQVLLDFFQPMFLEQELDAVKGIGWALKTLGRYYPELLVPWLENQLAQGQPRATMLRKALTYLPARKRKQLQALVPA